MVERASSSLGIVSLTSPGWYRPCRSNFRYLIGASLRFAHEALSSHNRTHCCDALIHALIVPAAYVSKARTCRLSTLLLIWSDGSPPPGCSVYSADGDGSDVIAVSERSKEVRKPQLVAILLHIMSSGQGAGLQQLQHLKRMEQFLILHFECVSGVIGYFSFRGGVVDCVQMSPTTYVVDRTQLIGGALISFTRWLCPIDSSACSVPAV